MKMLKKKPVGQRRVYDIEVEDVHNFYANGINVHNCATDGGVSVIKDDGTVVDITGYTNPARFVEFDARNQLYTNANLDAFVSVWEQVPDADTTTTSADYTYNRTPPLAGRDYAQQVFTPANSNTLAAHDLSAGLVPGFTLFLENPADYGAGATVDITSTYNTGWMNGDIKGAFLSDTDDTDLVGSGELVTNGTFDTDVSGWTARGVDGGTDTTFSWNASGYMDVTRGTGSLSGRPDQGFPTVAGKTYTISIDVVTAQRAFWIVGSSAADDDLVSAVTHFGNTTVTKTFVATSSTSYVAFWTDVSATTGIDNISVKLADEDRSVNNNGLIVNGTVTRSPVATGADLVAYSGFSSSNYLEQPYNSDLDFGTGDFCVMGWVKFASGQSGTILDRNSTTSVISSVLHLDVDSVGDLRILGSNAFTSSGIKVDTGSWEHFGIVRKDGVMTVYKGGDIQTAYSATDDVTDTSATLRIGQRSSEDRHAQGSLALWRISATAPTAEQIRKIYEDEKVLFQENAQATLYGTSDAVTALAHDPVTDLLHVGTSDGRSVFQGLRRVDNTTDAVGTAISASNNLIVEE